MKTTILRLSIILHTIGVNILTYGKKCGPSEFESKAGECCPMCNLGTVLLRACVGTSGVTCIPCSYGTFMDKPNGLYKCFSCKTCDKEQGLHMSSSCTTMRNAVCGLLDGYHCKDRNDDNECTFALKHSQCVPGEKIKSAGTEFSDTVCEACPSGFYSPLGVNCTKWTDCSAKDEVQHKKGSSVEDVQCRPKQPRHRYVLLLTAALLLLCLGGVYLLKKSENSKQQSNRTDRTDDDKKPVEETASPNSPEENIEGD